jgi:hypothetical protein
MIRQLAFISILTVALAGFYRVGLSMQTNPSLADIPQITIISPDENLAFSQGTVIDIMASVASAFDATRVEYFVNGKSVGETREIPHMLKYTVAQNASLIAVAYNADGKRTISRSVQLRTRTTDLPAKSLR